MTIFEFSGLSSVEFQNFERSLMCKVYLAIINTKIMKVIKNVDKIFQN